MPRADTHKYKLCATLSWLAPQFHTHTCICASENFNSAFLFSSSMSITSNTDSTPCIHTYTNHTHIINEVIHCNTTVSYTSLHVSAAVLAAHLLGAFLDDIGGDVWELFEEGVLAPHGLGHHLGQLHGTQCGRQPAIATQHIHTGLDQSNGLRNVKGTK